VPEHANFERLKGYLQTDKKTIGGRLFFVLPTEIGKVQITDDVDEGLIDQVLR